jgi:cell wall-associated NlpC family hydrolase
MLRVGVLLVALMTIASFGLPMVALVAVQGTPWGSWWLAGQGGAVVATPRPVAVPVAAPVPTAAPVETGLAAALVNVARQWLGVPYRWGGCDRRGIDCSCFVRNVWAAFGVNMPRTTTEQIRWAIPVPRAQLQIGDLLFFDNTCTGCGPNPTHVGMYIGGGQMIHAGDPVQISPAFGGLQFAGAGRVR